MLEGWKERVEEKVERARAAGEEVGACIVPDPIGGPPFCELADKDTCENLLKGTFIGGDCAGR